jgi:hypothetical protein
MMGWPVFLRFMQCNSGGVGLRSSARSILFLAAFTGAVGVTACTDQLESGAGCPLLCPTQEIVLRDTIIEAVALDTTVHGFPPVGQEVYHLLASRGDTLQTRVVFRFDTLPRTWRPSASPNDTAISRVDSAHLRLRLRYPVPNPSLPVTIEAYDVDSIGHLADADTSGRTALPQFRPDRFLGSVTFVPAALTDSLVRIPVSDSAVLEKIRSGARLRVGLRAAEGSYANIALSGIVGDFIPRLVFKPGADTLLFALPSSETPLNSRFFLTALIDYTLVVRSAEPLHLAQTLAVGGLPGRRTYFRFDLPPSIADTATVVRATLLLTQRPSPLAPDANDSVTVYSQSVVAGSAVTDITRAAGFLNTTREFGFDSVTVAPADSGLRSFDLSTTVRVWRVTTADAMPRAIVLRLREEGFTGSTIHFFASDADPAVRPRLRLTYAPRVPLGVP